MVVLALDQTIPALVADILDSRLACGGVINRLATGAGATTAQSSHNGVERQIVAQDRIEDDALRGQQGVQGLGLRQRPREPVEQESAPAAEASGSLLDH